jgi:hypothetical protein
VTGFVRFAAFAVLLVALLVLVVLPAAATPFLTQAVRDMGLRADELEVSVDSFDLSLLSGRSQRLRVRGTNIELPPAQVGRADLTFGRVSILDRSFESVRGELADVKVLAGGLAFEVASARVQGPASTAQATAHLSAAETEQLIMRAARREGRPLERVRLAGGGVRVSSNGVETLAGLAVEGGAMVLAPLAGAPVLLLQPAPAEPWRLTAADVNADGLTISGVVDAARLAERISVAAGR